MPYVKVYIHCVWSTKNRIQMLQTADVRNKLWQHIIENSRNKGIFIDTVSGYSDHCHCIISLSTDQSIQKVIQLIKGESSYWINKNRLTEQKFEWQDEYFALSVSESMIEKVRGYIMKQEEHHRKKTFQEEFDEFIAKYKF
ncbi:putative transposase [Dysgonomonas sp. PFB1-18]|uniref:IS200/IS605 family transposase n=1 Tax=unclassified Dysgonomonas TaxID=2630389 RepID=UPI0024738D48|nr:MULTISPECIES: IS200/IS605 family transposase [unclassified Dysgonomonas]MDH6309333.1 putative transposase [Dysgonomonas sp. PF1-14]MDH6339802.1 putative transposase [Dysgonomonas sp. PF1-16]MDH6381450.1 putative transposase [Dysgonomonas sp. PFB1-18]MDH6398665.1 putative transposase [Dysgonomonas sp. PF1-23]